MLSAEEAKQLGLVTFVESDEQIVEKVKSYAQSLAEGPGFALGLAKMLLNRSANHSLDEMLEMERFAQAMCMQTDDHREGLGAFHEKCKPRYVGRKP